MTIRIQKIRTEEIKGAALDYAVAIAQGLKPEILISGYGKAPEIWAATPGCPTKARYMPSESPAIGAPIVFAELIQLTPLCQDNPLYGWAAAYKSRGEYGEDFYSMHRQRGRHPLVAAMRCYLMKRHGDFVEVPAALVERA